jgi:hypothetical protein
MSERRPSAGARSELRRTIQPWDTEIPLLSADPFDLDARLVIDGEEYVRCTGRSGYTLTGCERGLSPEEGGVAPKRWLGGTVVEQVTWTAKEIVTEYPVATRAMIGRDFEYQPGDGNSYAFHVVEIEGTPIIIWDDEPPSAMAFLWSSQITGLTDVSGVALDTSGNIYAGLLSTQLHKYSSGLAQQWTTAGLFGASGPRHITTDGTSVFATSSGTLYKRLATTGGAGTPPSFGGDSSANHVGITGNGTNIWISLQGYDLIDMYTVTGAYVSSIGSPGAGNGQFMDPTGLTLVAGKLWVLDAGNGRIQRFNAATGAWETTFTLGIGTAEGQIGTTAEGITVDSTGRIWVADTPNHRLNVYDSAGVFLASFGSFGSGDGQFKSPKQLAAGADDRIWVADSGNGRLVTVQADLGQITPVITTRTNAGTVAASSGNAITVTCDAGEVAIGGGGEMSGDSVSVNTRMTFSRPSGTTAWIVGFYNASGSSQPITAYVRCLQTPF